MVLFVYGRCIQVYYRRCELKQKQCIIEKNFYMIRRFANERGIIITEENIIQNAFGGIGISLMHNGSQWLIETDEFNEKYVLKHLSLGLNPRRKESRYHEHIRSSYYNIIIQHIFTHHNVKHRKVTKKNKESIGLENAFSKVERERENRNKLRLVK